MIYRCHYKPIEDGPSTVDGSQLHDFTQGFWLNETFELTTASDCKFWIPPSSINFIEKISVYGEIFSKEWQRIKS